MFGFGFFSSHLPYLVLLIGYVVCWLWNIQCPTEEPDRVDISIETAKIESDHHFAFSDDSGIDIFDISNLKKTDTSDIFSFSCLKFQPRLLYSIVHLSSERLLKVLGRDSFFLRPPPFC